MNTHELCCVGHITLDKVVTPKNTVHMPGGTSFYFSHAIKHFDDIDYTLVTALAESEMKTVEELRAEGIDVAVMPSKHTVYFENIYGENKITVRNVYWRKQILSPWNIWRTSTLKSSTLVVCLPMISLWKW